MIAEHVQKMLKKFMGRIIRGRLDEVGILADWLEGIEHPKAVDVRGFYDTWDSRITRLLNGQARVRRCWSLADECGVSHCALRAKLLSCLGSARPKNSWSFREIRKMWDANRDLTPLPGIKDDESQEDGIQTEDTQEVL